MKACEVVPGAVVDDGRFADSIGVGRGNDLNNKKAAYERLAVPCYWVIDPQQPTLIAFELDPDGRYRQVAEVKGEDAFEAVRPFPLRVVPVELLGTLAR